jgi:hypothetical protein
MFRLIITILLFNCFSIAQTYERWIWADTENQIQDGSKEYPFKYISQIDFPAITPYPDLIIINFMPAVSKYSYDGNNHNERVF